MPAESVDHHDIVLAVNDLVVEHKGRGRGKGPVRVVTGVSFEARRGETVGIVGESGSGKSSTVRAILQLPAPTSGRVLLEGQDLTRLRGRELRARRRMLQLVQQDPVSSLNPRRRARDIVAEGLRVWGRSEDEAAAVTEVMAAVGLDLARIGDARPTELSGGQCQRLSIARSLIAQPAVLVCDEPTAALDVSVQAQILNLLLDLRRQRQITMIFVSHDLAAVKVVSDQVVVMYRGRISEIGTTERVFRHPAHPYTAALLSASRPGLSQGLPTTSDDSPTDSSLDLGCRYRNRCPSAGSRCATEQPVLREVAHGQSVACHFPMAPK